MKPLSTHSTLPLRCVADAKQHLYANIWETGANDVAITATDDDGAKM